MSQLGGCARSGKMLLLKGQSLTHMSLLAAAACQLPSNGASIGPSILRTPALLLHVDGLHLVTELYTFCFGQVDTALAQSRDTLIAVLLEKGLHCQLKQVLALLSEASYAATPVQQCENIVLHNRMYDWLRGVPQLLRNEFPPVTDFWAEADSTD